MAGIQQNPMWISKSWPCNFTRHVSKRDAFALAINEIQLDILGREENLYYRGYSFKPCITKKNVKDDNKGFNKKNIHILPENTCRVSSFY